jgi:hypothetical protein
MTLHALIATGDAPLQLLHPLRYWGYEWWSGAGSDLGELTLLGLAIAFWHQHNCHIKGCWRLQWHAHPDHGHPCCKKHHPDDPPAADV